MTTVHYDAGSYPDQAVTDPGLMYAMNARRLVCSHAESLEDAAELLFALGIHPRSRPPRGRKKKRKPPRVLVPGVERRPPGDACGDRVGSVGSYGLHLADGEHACEACLAAHLEAWRLVHTPCPRALATCGTWAARRRHRRHGEGCDRCWATSIGGAL